LDVFQPKAYFVTSAITGMWIDQVYQTIVDLKANKIVELSPEKRARQCAAPFRTGAAKTGVLISFLEF
jgi:hypothetical protein